MFRFHKLLAPLALALAACLTTTARSDEAKADRAEAQNQNRADQQDTIKGRVQNVSDNRIVVRDENNRDWAFQIARDAKVRVNDQEARAADLKDGDEVAVSFRRVARSVRTAQGEQAGQFAAGRVERVSADGNQLVIKGHGGQEQTFQVGQNARINVNGKEGKLSELKEGDHAVVAYSKGGEASEAREVISQSEDRGEGLAAGQVESVSADHDRIVLKDQGGHEHAFQLGRDAQVRVNDKEGKASDLQQGSRAVVAYVREASEVTGQRGNK